jgi:RND superfamily putative drug exporter
VLVAWIAGAATTATLLPSLGSQVNNDNSAFLPARSPSIVAQDMLTPILGKENFTNQLEIVADRRDGELTTADQAAIAAVASRASRVPHVIQVVQVATSPDEKASVLAVRVSIDNFAPSEATSLVDRLTRAADGVRAPAGLHFYVAGPLATDVANNKKSQTTASNLSFISVLFILVLLFFIFRSLIAPFVTILPAVLVLVVAGGIVGGLGEAGLKVSQFTQLLMIVLLLGAGTDYALFLVFRVREELWNGREPKEAVAVALSRVGESISASAGTVIIALLTLTLASFGIYRDLGIPLAIAVSIMLLAGLTLLPALLAVLGRAVFWPFKVRPGDTRATLWGRAAARLVQRPVLTLTVGVLIFGALAAAVAGYRPGGFGGAVTAPAGSAAAQGNAVLSRHFPHTASQPTDVVLVLSHPVWQDPQAVLRAQHVLAASPRLDGVQGPLDPTGVSISPGDFAVLHAKLGIARLLSPIEPAALQETVPPPLYDIYRASAQFVSPDGKTVVFSVSLTAGDPGTTAVLHEVPQLRALASHAAQAAGARKVGLAGEAPGFYDVSTTSTRDLTHIVPIAALAIALLLALVLRSLVAPLYLIASVVLSYLAALGLAVVVFIYWRGNGGLTFLLPFLMFVFLLALGEDYNILVMTRIREEAHDLPLTDAVVRAVGATGPTITSAGLVLAGSFAILAISGGSGPSSAQVQAIGFGLAAGILMDTFLVRTVLVPATVSILGRFNWWPSKLSQDPLTPPPGEGFPDHDLEPAR